MSTDAPAATQHDVFDLTVIGGGPTGLFAAFYAGFREMRTKIIESIPELGGQLVTLYPDKCVYDVAGHPGIVARDLAALLIEQALKFDPAICLEEQVQQLDYIDGDVIHLRTNRSDHYTRALLICAGVGSFSPNRLSAANAARFENNGVFYYVRDKSKWKDKNIVIVGGGDSAMDWALNLHDIAKSITLVHRRDAFRAHESSVKKVMELGIPMHLWSELTEVVGTDRVEGAVIVNSKTGVRQRLDADVILGTIGFKAELGPLKEWPVEYVGKDIRVNGHMATSMRGVFAAGDVALPDGAVKLSLISVGFAQAAMAVCSAKVYVDPSSNLFPGHSSSKLG